MQILVMMPQSDIRALMAQIEQQRIILSRLVASLDEELKETPNTFLAEIKQILSGIEYSADQLIMQLEKGAAKPGEERSLARMTHYAVSKIRRMPFGLRPVIIEDLNELARCTQ